MVLDRVQQGLDDDSAQCAASPSDDLDRQEAAVTGKESWLIEAYSLRVELHRTTSTEGRFVWAPRRPGRQASGLRGCFLSKTLVRSEPLRLLPVDLAWHGSDVISERGAAVGDGDRTRHP